MERKKLCKSKNEVKKICLSFFYRVFNGTQKLIYYYISLDDFGIEKGFSKVLASIRERSPELEEEFVAQFNTINYFHHQRVTGIIKKFQQTRIKRESGFWIGLSSVFQEIFGIESEYRKLENKAQDKIEQLKTFVFSTITSESEQKISSLTSLLILRNLQSVPTVLKVSF